MDRDDFFRAYLQYTGGGEVPVFFNRWSAIAGLGALLGRQYWVNHGRKKLYPNTYCMLIGTAGSRKSTAINTIREILQLAEYQTIAADKSSKEKFLVDLSGEPEQEFDARGKPIASTAKSGADILASNLWGDDDSKANDTSEMFIMADEFNDFLGSGNMDFISLLGNLWDYNGTYRSRIKNGKSVAVPNPTVSILGGNTPTGFNLAFPPEAIGQGFFSRLLLVYAKETGLKITFPEPPDPVETQQLIDKIKQIKATVRGPAVLMPAARELLDKIYKTYGGFEDARFESYSNRRFTHLLKLCLIVSAASGRSEITCADIIYANTVLSHTEHLMPKALGEFGRAKNSGAAHRVMQMLDGTSTVMTLLDLWKGVSSDLDGMRGLTDILQSLSAAGKIQAVNGGFLPNKKVVEYVTNEMLDYRILTKQEREISI